MATVQSLKAKAVESSLAPLFVRSNYIHDQAQQRQVGGSKEIHSIPGIGSLSVGDDGSADVAAQSVSDASLDLNINRNPMVNIEVPMQDGVQNLDGAGWADQLASEAAVALRNKIDRDMAIYLGREIAYDASATHHINVAGATLTKNMLLEALASLKSNDGAIRPAFFLHPFGSSSVMAIDGFQANYVPSPMGEVGLNMLGAIFGAPVFETTSVERNAQITSTAWSVSTGTLTITVPEGHGLVPGQLVTFDTVTAGGDLSAETAITSVTATTVVIGSSGLSDGSATEAGTITTASAANLVVDLANVFVGMQRRPQVRFVPRENRTSENLQVSALWGRVARAGRVKVLHTDADSV